MTIDSAKATAAVAPLVLNGNSRDEHIAREQHHAALTAFFDKNPPQNLPPGARIPDAPPARQSFTAQAAPGGEGTPAERAAASAPAPTVDQAYLDALTRVYRSKSEAERTTEFRAQFEREYAEALNG